MALMLIVIFLLALVSNQITQTQANYMYHVCSQNTTFTLKSKYQKNLKTLLASLPSHAADPTTNGFGNYEVSGNNTEASYGQFLCRGDLSNHQCRECVKNATQQVVQRCPNETTSIIWYDECMLRYSNESFSLRSDMEPSVEFFNEQSVGNDTTRFAQLVNDTIKGLATKLTATGGISGKMFEAAKVKFTSSDTLYAFAQCVPFLSNKNCNSCLMQSNEKLAGSTRKGGRVLTPSCNVRFELYVFYNTSVLPSQAPEPAPGPVPFLSPPVEAPVQYPPAPTEPPVQYPPPPPPGAPDAPPPVPPSEVPTSPGSVDGPPTVATPPGTGNSRKSSSTFVTIATPIVASLVLLSFKF